MKAISLIMTLDFHLQMKTEIQFVFPIYFLIYMDFIYQLKKINFLNYSVIIANMNGLEALLLFDVRDAEALIFLSFLIGKN